MATRLQNTLGRLTPKQKARYFRTAAKQFSPGTRAGKQRRNWPAEKKKAFLERIAMREFLPKGKSIPLGIPSYKETSECISRGFFPVIFNGRILEIPLVADVPTLYSRSTDAYYLQGVYRNKGKLYTLRTGRTDAFYEINLYELRNDSGKFAEILSHTNRLGGVAVPFTEDNTHFRKIFDSKERGQGLGKVMWEKAERQTIISEPVIRNMRRLRVHNSSSVEGETHFRKSMENQGFVLENGMWSKPVPYAFKQDDMNNYHAIEIISPTDGKRKTLYFLDAAERKKRYQKGK